MGDLDWTDPSPLVCRPQIWTAETPVRASGPEVVGVPRLWGRGTRQLYRPPDGVVKVDGLGDQGVGGGRDGIGSRHVKPLGGLLAEKTKEDARGRWVLRNDLFFPSSLGAITLWTSVTKTKSLFPNETYPLLETIFVIRILSFLDYPILSIYGTLYTKPKFRIWVDNVVYTPDLSETPSLSNRYLSPLLTTGVIQQPVLCLDLFLFSRSSYRRNFAVYF